MYRVRWQTLTALLLLPGTLLSASVLAAPGDPLTPEILVNSLQGNVSYSLDTPDVARSANGLTVVVWSALGDSASPQRPTSIRARLFGADGTPVGSEITISEDRINNFSMPAVAMNASGAFAVAWRAGFFDEPQIAVRLYGPDGTPRSAITRASTAATPQVSERSDIAIDDSGRVTVAFQPFLLDDIRLRQFDASGVALTDRETVVSDGNADALKAPVLAMQSDGNFVLAWEQRTDARDIPVPFPGPFPFVLTPEREEIRFRRFAANGLPKAASTVVDQAFTFDAFVAGGLAGSLVGEPGIGVDTDGDTVVAWPAATAAALATVRARRYDASGNPVGQIIVAGPLTSRSAAHVAVSSDRAGNFALSWNNNTQILARRYRANGIAAAPAFVVNPTYVTNDRDGSRTAIAHDGAGNLAINWKSTNSNVLLRVYEGP